MEILRSLEWDLAYFKTLVDAGWDGIRSIPRERDGDWAVAKWAPIAVGATLGVLSMQATKRRTSASKVALGGLAGTLLGFGASQAWALRHIIGPAAGAGLRNVNVARDAHWLETHPITYA